MKQAGVSIMDFIADTLVSRSSASYMEILRSNIHRKSMFQGLVYCSSESLQFRGLV